MRGRQALETRGRTRTRATHPMWWRDREEVRPVWISCLCLTTAIRAPPRPSSSSGSPPPPRVSTAMSVDLPAPVAPATATRTLGQASALAIRCTTRTSAQRPETPGRKATEAQVQRSCSAICRTVQIDACGTQKMGVSTAPAASDSRRRSEDKGSRAPGDRE